MLASRQTNGDNNRLQNKIEKKNTKNLLPGDSIEQRPKSNDSTESIDNAYSLEHLFKALRRRIHRILQNYDPTSFYNALKICARVFKSYASYNLNTINEFARRLNKTPRDNQKLLQIIDQYCLHLSELRHCHSTFEAELLVNTLALDFHENDLEQTEKKLNLTMSRGKFSPRSRFSKFRLHQIRQALDLKNQVKKINENLRILLFDEFNANLSILTEESEKFVSSSLAFHDHHMTYVLRLIPDIGLKFEQALQICTKLFDLETTINESQTQPMTNRNQNLRETESLMTMNYTPRSDFNRSQQDVSDRLNYQSIPSGKTIEPLSTLHSAEVTSASTNSSTMKPSNSAANEKPNDFTIVQSENPVFPSLFTSSERFVDTKNDRSKLELLSEQLEKRLNDERAYRTRLINCLQKTSKKPEEFQRENYFLTFQNSSSAVIEYKNVLRSKDHQVHQSVSDELNLAVLETQHRIDWLNNVLQRARQCLNFNENS